MPDVIWRLAFGIWNWREMGYFDEGRKGNSGSASKGRCRRSEDTGWLVL